MITSLNKPDLLDYTASQLNNFFPDRNRVDLHGYHSHVDSALDRLHYCFKHVAFERYFKNNETIFNHLYADHYLMYLWFLANTIWREEADDMLASKLYYLNKSLHGLDCMYTTKLPDIFLIFHGVGTMLGKANYSDYFVTLQGCTVGSHKGKYPTFGKGVALTANSSAIGECNFGHRATISTRTTVFNKDIPEDYTAFTDFENGTIKMKESRECYAQQFFNVNLKNLY